MSSTMSAVSYLQSKVTGAPNTTPSFHSSSDSTYRPPPVGGGFGSNQGGGCGGGYGGGYGGGCGSGGGIIAAPAMQAEVALIATATMQTRAAVGVIIHLEKNQRRRSSRSLREKSLQSHQRRWWTYWTWMRSDARYCWRFTFPLAVHIQGCRTGCSCRLSPRR